MALETVATCPVCNGRDYKHFLTTKDYTVTGEAFHLVNCTTCGFTLTNPRPDQTTIGPYYQSTLYISHTGGSTALIDKVYRAVRRRAIQEKLSLIARYQKPTTLLDYGSGTGDFLAASVIKGWAALGVEPSPNARMLRPDLTVHAQLKEVQGRFDVITLWHVLEHVHELSSTLEQLRTKLNPGGILVIAVPNRQSWDAQHYQSHWAGYDVPRHLWHFTKESMARLLTNHLLHLKEIHPMKFDSYYVSLLSEGYQHPGNKLSNIANGFLNGLRSNLAAGSDNYSSLIYIAGS